MVLMPLLKIDTGCMFKRYAIDGTKLHPIVRTHTMDVNMIHRTINNWPKRKWMCTLGLEIYSGTFGLANFGQAR